MGPLHISSGPKPDASPAALIDAMLAVLGLPERKAEALRPFIVDFIRTSEAQQRQADALERIAVSLEILVRQGSVSV